MYLWFQGQALASFFASVNPRLDLGDPAHRQLVEEAEERPNRLPDEVRPLSHLSSTLCLCFWTGFFCVF